MTRSGVPQDAARPRRRHRRGAWPGGPACGLCLVSSGDWPSSWGSRSGELGTSLNCPTSVTLSICTHLAQPIVIADDDNAYVRYNEAHAKLGKVTRGVSTALRNNATGQARVPISRSSSSKTDRRLELWREGTDRPDALYHQPAETALDTLLPLAQDISIARPAGRT